MSLFRNLLDFSGKNIVITGGLGLIGREVVRAFLEYNANVIIADVDETYFSTLTTEKTRDRCFFTYFDIGQLEKIPDNITSLVMKHKKIDAWINTAYPRTSDWNNHIEDITFTSWDQNIRTHLGGYFWTSKYILEHMKEQRNGSLINFGSIYGVVGPNFEIYKDTEMTTPVAYAAIKGGIVNLTRYFSALYGQYNVRVNTICPGGVFNHQAPWFVERYNTLTPLKRMAKAYELAMPTLFLASDAASYITGHTLMVDGGWTAW